MYVQNYQSVYGVSTRYPIITGRQWRLVIWKFLGSVCVQFVNSSSGDNFYNFNNHVFELGKSFSLENNIRLDIFFQTSKPSNSGEYENLKSFQQLQKRQGHRKKLSSWVFSSVGLIWSSFFHLKHEIGMHPIGTAPYPPQ